MNTNKKTYQTPEAEIILFGEDIITCSTPYEGDTVFDDTHDLPLY